MDGVLSQHVRIRILNPGSGYPDNNDLMAVFSSLNCYSIPKTINMESIERAHVPELRNIRFHIDWDSCSWTY